MKVSIDVPKEVVKVILSGGDYIETIENFVSSIQCTSDIADQVKAHNEDKQRNRTQGMGG